MERVERRHAHGSQSLVVRGRVSARAGSAAPGSGSTVEPDIDPASLVRGIEASLLRAGLEAYDAVIDGALALIHPRLPGRHIDVRV